MVRFRFRGTLSGIDAATWVNSNPRLRRFRDHLETSLPGPADTRRSRAQSLAESLLVAAMDDFGTHYIDTLSHHIDEIRRLRDELRSHYEAVDNLSSGTALPENVTPQRISALFQELEQNLKAIDGVAPTNHMRRSRNTIPTERMDRVSDDIQRGTDPRFTGEGEPPRRDVEPDLPLDDPLAPVSRRPANADLPNISDSFRFDERRVGSEFIKQAEGDLGVPGEVRTHRDEAAQRRVSQGMGDDAGHLIGDRFGAPGGEENLSLQNWVSNRSGTFKSLENRWARRLQAGNEIHVTVRDHTRVGEARPYKREVVWTETRPNGSRQTYHETFGNFDTPESRAARGRTDNSGTPGRRD